MARYMVAILLLVVLASPALGKTRNDSYPVSCSDLWAAVQDTLANPGNYKVMVSDEVAMTASYVIVGAQRQRVNTVDLEPVDKGCELKVDSPDSGFANGDEATFRKRVGRSLAKLQAAKPSAPAKAGGAD